MSKKKKILLGIIIFIIFALCVGGIYYKKSFKINFETFEKYVETRGTGSVSYICTVYSYNEEMYLSNYVFNCGNTTVVVKKLNSNEKNLIKNSLKKLKKEKVEANRDVFGGSTEYGIYYNNGKETRVNIIDLVDLGIIESVEDYKTEYNKEAIEGYKDYEKQLYNSEKFHGLNEILSYIKCIDEQIKSYIFEEVKNVYIKEKNDKDTYIIEIITETDKKYEGLVTNEGYVLEIVKK